MMFRIILVSLFIVNLKAFPNGAPPEACETLIPRHGKVKPQPYENSPFDLVQYSSSYGPGKQINVEIVPKDGSGDLTFKGFLVQALDANTLEYIGDFMDGEGMQIMKECSAITHTDRKPKNSANLIWQSPEDKEGHVIFRATIAVNGKTIYANLIAQELPQQYNPSAQ